MKMTSFERLKDLDITSVAISDICFINEILLIIIKEIAALFDFTNMLLYLPNGSPQPREAGILISSECLITLISNVNLMNRLKHVPIISQISRKIFLVSLFPPKSPDSRNKFVFLPKQPLLELSPPVTMQLLA